MQDLIREIESIGLAETGFGSESAFIGGYLLQQSPSEFAQLIKALQDYTITSYLQVGSAAGGSERFICEKTGCKHLDIIDLGQHPQFGTWTNFNKLALEAQGVVIREFLGDSHSDEAQEFVGNLGLRPSLIGIDGDHTPAGARMDFELIAPLLVPGSLVWLHDTNAEKIRPCDSGASEVWEKLKSRHKVILEVKEMFGIGLIEISA